MILLLSYIKKQNIVGLIPQICFTTGDGKRYYTNGSNDEKTLASFNTECEKNGCKKDEWK